MKKILLLGLLCWQTAIGAQNTVPSPATLLQGRWEVLEYAEQGIQVNKSADALRQAVSIYRNIQQERARVWYGYDENVENEYSKRRMREFERWATRDSTQEVQRITEAIATPYFAVFFADSTLALYNRETATGRVLFPQSRRYIFSPATMSIDIFPPGFMPPAAPGSWVDRWEVQILELTTDRMVLFIPEEGEVVVLRKAAGKVP
jgi:hypothetical protein